MSLEEFQIAKAGHGPSGLGISVHRLIKRQRKIIMPAYIVFTRTKTLDQRELEAYWAGIKDTMKGHPIEVLVAYGNHEVLEGDPIEGIVIAKFPTIKAAKDWYGSQAYQSVAKHRQKGAIYQGVVVEGIA